MDVLEAFQSYMILENHIYQKGTIAQAWSVAEVFRIILNK